MRAQADWFSYRISDGAKVNLTAKLGLNFWREDHDSPSLPPAYGSAGWTAERSRRCCSTTSTTSGKSGRTAAARAWSPAATGGRQQIVFRYRSLDPEERAIPADKPLLLSANDDKTERQRLLPRRADGGSARAREDRDGADKAFGPVIKAKNADRARLHAGRASTSSRICG